MTGRGSGGGTPGDGTTYVVLLRAVNLGAHRRIAMADLRDLLAGLGFTGVRTVLASGNAVMSGPPQEPAGIARQVEEALVQRLGLRTGCLVLTGEELLGVVAGDPFGESAGNGSRYVAIFLSADPDPGLRIGHDPVELDPQRVRVGRRVIYQWCPDGILAAPPVGGFVERHWKVSATARNWNTVTKLAALAVPARAD
ncbi:MAG TPA: DUF1697 domain-containing protein [Kineosporiaceae bacterium]|nr:DUF1697 domain-containing protein [Kineosporiaceae bacterium]